MDYSSNFGEEIKSIVEDLKDSYPDITFQLVDTRYFELNKKYNYFKSYKQEKLMYNEYERYILLLIVKLDH